MISATTPTQTITYSHDANGNTITKAESGVPWGYSWDHENRLSQAATPTAAADYKYDALGRRVQRIRGSENTKFIHDGWDVLADDNGGTLTRYVNGGGIDNKLQQSTGSTISYFLADHLGSTNGLADSNGALTASMAYDSFGNATNPNFPSRYQFTGREYDPFSGLHYYRARWYDGKLGRFVSEDPIGLAGGINQFEYVGNDPTNGTDPLGLYEEDVHYYLTYYLAKRNGCFSDIEARIIAFGNQSTDDVATTAPGYGAKGPNSLFHALNHEARPGLGSSILFHRATRPFPSDYYFGQYLHYYQDTYSHRGYPNSTYGHLWGSHSVDKTAHNVQLALDMAMGTSEELSKYSMIKCGCGGRGWDDETEDTVKNFAGVGTAFPRLADINGGIGLNLGGFLFASPAALDEKVRLLGLGR